MAGIGLSLEAEQALLSQAAAGDEKAIGTLLQAYEPLIIHLAQKLAFSELEAAELCRGGRIALWQAFPSYNPQKGEPAPYFFTVIRNGMVKTLWQLYPLSGAAREAWQAVKAAREHLAELLEREPSIEDVAAEAQVALEVVAEIASAYRRRAASMKEDPTISDVPDTEDAPFSFRTEYSMQSKDTVAYLFRRFVACLGFKAATKFMILVVLRNFESKKFRLYKRRQTAEVPFTWEAISTYLCDPAPMVLVPQRPLGQTPVRKPMRDTWQALHRFNYLPDDVPQAWPEVVALFTEPSSSRLEGPTLDPATPAVTAGDSLSAAFERTRKRLERCLDDILA